MNAEEGYADARLKVVRARARAAETGQEIRVRLAPETIAQNAWHKVRETGEDIADRGVTIARSHPAATAGAGAAALMLVLRRPIWRGAKWLLSRRRRAADEQG